MAGPRCWRGELVPASLNGWILHFVGWVLVIKNKLPCWGSAPGHIFMSLCYFDIFCELLKCVCYCVEGSSLQLQGLLLSNSVFSSHSCSHRLKFQSNPTLKYLYPPPTNSTLTNIAHALVSVPRFYVQVSNCCFSCFYFSFRTSSSLICRCWSPVCFCLDLWIFFYAGFFFSLSLSGKLLQKCKFDRFLASTFIL